MKYLPVQKRLLKAIKFVLLTVCLRMVRYYMQYIGTSRFTGIPLSVREARISKTMPSVTSIASHVFYGYRGIYEGT